MERIPAQLRDVRGRIARACAAVKRPVESVTLLAVGKTFPPAALRAAFDAGQRAFGENYAQEALAKIEALADLRPHIEWHLIGPLQGNKARVAAELFDWVETIDRPRIAERLAAARAGRPALDVLVQVNVSGEATKSGVAPGEALALARYVASLPNLRLRGIMGIPAPTSGAEAARGQFRALRACFDTLRTAGLRVDTLSMGMSADLEPAIAEGSTEVRVGTAIFGERTKEAA